MEFGDHQEQRLWPLLSRAFPAYEIFWRRYVVPLTNRIDPNISFANNRDIWIRLRADVHQKQEQLAMHHYSVFYYLARAAEQLEAGEDEFPEDIFCLLDACGDNALEFSRRAGEILSDFGLSISFLPTRKDQLCCLIDQQKANGGRGGLVEVQEYRDTILHNPVLGRGVQTSRQFLPRREYLAEVKLSWRKAACLTSEQMIESKALYDRLLEETTNFLQETWVALIVKFDGIRGSDKFRKKWSISDQFLPVILPSTSAGMLRPTVDSGAASLISPACSGTFNVSAVPGQVNKR